jgi:uncharacterized protein (TIRG00374 family)
MDSSTTSLFRGKIGILLRAILAVVLLVLLFQFVDIRGVAAAFSRAKTGYLLGALALVVLNLGLQMAKWRYFVRLVNPESTNLETTASLLFGISLGAVTPGQIGEFGGRALRHRSLAAGSVVGLTLVDKLQMMCVMGVAGSVCLVVLLHPPFPFGVLSATFLCLTFTFLFFIAGSLFTLISRAMPRLREHQLFKEFISAVGIFKKKDLLVSLTLSASFYGVIYLQMFFLLNAFDHVSAGDAFLGFGAMMFVKSLLPISLGDLGVREATSVYFFSLCGVAHSTSLSASLLLFTINILLPSALGLLFIPKLPAK